MRKRNLLLFITAGLFLLTSLLIQLRVPLIEFGIPRLLPKAIFSNTNLVLDSIDTNQATASSFKTRITTPQGVLYLNSTGISLAFTLGELKRGFLRRATIKTLTVTLPSFPKNETERSLEDYTQRTAGILQQLKRIELPVYSLDIEEILIKNGPLPAFETRPGSLHIAQENSLVAMKAILPVPSGEELIVNLQQTGKGSLKAEIKPGFLIPESRSRLSAGISSSQVRFNGVLYAEDIKRFMPPAPMFPFPHRLELRTKMELDKMPMFTADVRAEKITHAKISAEHIHLSLAGRLNTVNDIRLDPDSRLLSEKIETAGLQAKSLVLDLTGSYHLDGKNWNADLTARTPLLITNPVIDKMSMDSLKLVKPLKLKSVESGISIHTSKDTALHLNGFDMDRLSIPSLRLSPLTKAPLQVKIQDDKIGFTGPEWILSPSGVNVGKITLQSAPLVLRVKKATLPEPDLLLEAGTTGIQITADKYHLPFKDINAVIQLKDNIFTGKVDLSPENTPGRMEGAMHHDVESGKGGASVATSEAIKFSSGADSSSLVKGLNLPFTLNKGALILRTETGWNRGKPLRASASMQLSQGAGSIREYQFSGLNLKKNLQLLPKLHSKQRGRISLARLDTPVPLFNLEASPSVRQFSKGKLPLLTLAGLTAQLFDGRLSADTFTLDLTRSTNNITLRASNFSLPKVLELLKVKGLEVTGRMNGRIPLRIASGKVSVEGGEFTGTEAGGIIRYKPPDTGASRSQFTAYAMKALEEFHFSKLKAPVTYRPDGSLIVDLQLQGKSPLLETTRPVHFNIHTEQNLLSLLKSLQYSKAFTKELDKQLQQRP